jgi:hypothetical protein
MKTKIIIIAAFFSFASMGCEKDVLIQKPGYCIGIVDFYAYGHPSSHITFEYTVSNIKYYASYGDGQNGWSVPNYKGYKTGDQFMVQYDLNNPNTARMLFNYPVKDSTDYKRYVEQFNTTPPVLQ